MRNLAYRLQRQQESNPDRRTYQLPMGQPIYQTKLGAFYCGDAGQILRSAAVRHHAGAVQLVFTSPPFPLVRPKRYGNLQGRAYVEWIAGFASLLAPLLRPDGSIVIEIGNAFEPGSPVMSTWPYEALLAFRQAGELYLCQEFIWFNPARLPTPAQWVNVERCRVKDAFTRLWWMAPTPRPKADNRRVLSEYSSAMKTLLSKGTYNHGTRPSEHNIGRQSFLRDNGGAIPPNVLVHANTTSNDPFSTRLRATNRRRHPARMPLEVAEFFIKLLTEPGDLVLDPFAGSNTTGYGAEKLGRRWLSIELDEEYAEASHARWQSLDDAQSATDSARNR